ncbi:CBS domain-containing protein [Denitrobaculum tricleocarpae]|uniref:CBS domain-containing protein n=1 Tax=Denitrobaculum tricleocarpae TaxID=2591009 RepID=A0A545U342_9PROT|nr:CBS domain-containing protein [Denitrobaculum tricleocarpae]TQV83902.1 CBS domain-containing protein [Denitrobaculum tricleocarpae]
MTVKALLKGKGGSGEVSTIRSDITIDAAVRVLKEKRIGALVVCDDGKTIAGILSERDVVRGLADHGAVLMQMPVASLMTSTVKTTHPREKVDDVMSEMTQSRIRHLPVVQDGAICGLVSIGDVVKYRMKELESETSVLRDFIVGR